MRVAMLVNIPAPYRVPVYDRMAAALGSDFRALYMAPTESDRKWNVPTLRHDHIFLRGFSPRVGQRQIHVRRGVWRELSGFRPDVVMTGGFNPPMLEAWLYATTTGIAHVPMSDAWIDSEAALSWFHRRIRRVVYSKSGAYVGASQKTLRLFEEYGARENLFVSPLCVDNRSYARVHHPLGEREIDLVFAGNLIDRKLPLFFADVARKLAHQRGALAVLVIGDGALREQMMAALRAPGLDVTFTGFLQQEELPAAYARGKVLCFPTRNDPWGVVANEACASGMPVITCHNAGCAEELVIHGRNGYVLPLDVDTWVEHVGELLSVPDRLVRFGREAERIVAAYNYDAAAKGMLDACLAATRSRTQI